MERQAWRRAALRHALRTGDVIAAARAWERLRIDGGVVTREEAAAAHAARAAVGRALRDARWRRGHAKAPAASTLAAAIPLVRERALPRSRAAIAAAAVGLLVLALLLVTSPRRPEGAAPAAAAPEQAGVQPEPTRAPAGGRGRTSATLAPVVLALTTPPPSSPTPQESAAPPVASGPASTPATDAPVSSPSAVRVPAGVPGGAAGGTPGGVVGGVPGSVPPTPTPTPAPTPTPSVNVLPLNPPPLAAGSDRFLFQVIDARSGVPLANVCVLYGTLQCGPSDPHTNALGYFWLDLTAGVATNWRFRFSLDGYIPVSVNKTYRSGQGTVVTTVPLRRS